MFTVWYVRHQHANAQPPQLLGTYADVAAAKAVLSRPLKAEFGHGVFYVLAGSEFLPDDPAKYITSVTVC